MRSPFVVPPASLRSSISSGLPCAVGALLAGLACGCARNADFEISLTLPARPISGPQIWAVPVFLGGDFEFTSVAIDPPFPGQLLQEAPQRLDMSVLSERPDGHVRMIVFFCPNENCADQDPATLPQEWFDFERAHYIGHRTHWTGRIMAVPAGRPAAARCVDRCEVEGCIEGLGWFCREDGSHYCQERGADPGPNVCDP
ncbi:MAG: hypothetical protein K1X94_32435 [Sandaracinaceae bacterium]|nr:hypothetical protein [Sandaracinaceae bacterium]